MTINKILILIFITACLTLILSSVSAAINTPTTELKSTIDSILDILRDKSLSLDANKEKRRNMIRFLITGRFDFEEMTKRSLARHWGKRTTEEKKEFISIFSELLEASYIGKIEAYANEEISYHKETIKSAGKYAIVSTIIATENVNIPIDYKVIRKGNEWRVYDVLVEGVSFVSTYRSQFNKIIIKKSYTKLIQQMKNKLNEVNTILDKKPAHKQ